VRSDENVYHHIVSEGVVNHRLLVSFVVFATIPSPFLCREAGD
jgi:hypothetical protein